MRDKTTLIDDFADRVARRDPGTGELVVPDWGRTEWHLLFDKAEVLELSNGEILLKRDEPSNDLFFLAEGALEVSSAIAGSQSLTPLARITPASIVGEIAFFDDHARTASVWSRGASVVFRLRRSEFGRFREDHPQLAIDLLLAIGRVLAERLRGAQGRGQTSLWGSTGY